MNSRAPSRYFSCKIEARLFRRCPQRVKSRIMPDSLCSSTGSALRRLHNHQLRTAIVSANWRGSEGDGFEVWQPAPVEVNEDALPDRSAGQQGSASSAPQLAADHTNPEAAQSRAATRIALRPHDPGTGEEIDKREIVKGYEYGRGQFVTLTPEELKALDVESSKVIDLEKFAPRGDLDPVYFDSSYYLYPDGPIAVEALRVIGAAMAEAGVVGLGRLTLSRRERMVVVEPRGTGMALFTLRAAEEVRAAQFGVAEGEQDGARSAPAGSLAARRTGSLDPTTYRDRYQEALRELLEAKMKGR